MDQVKRYGSDLFSFNATERCFYVDSSVLEQQWPDKTKFGLVEGDRFGLVLKSTRTGEDVSFRIAHVEWSRENKILHWTLKPLDLEISKNPSIKDICCIVYNI